MKYKEFFSLERTCILNDRDKKVVFKKLIELIHKENTQVSSDEIYKRIMERETLLSTRITDDVGIPHAKIPQFNGTLAAVALCKNPIIYDVEEGLINIERKYSDGKDLLRYRC